MKDKKSSTSQKMKINRIIFLRNLTRILMLSLLAMIAIALGNKIASGGDCTGCPGLGKCGGKTDCTNY